MWNDNEFNSTFASPGGGGAAKDSKKNQIRYILPLTAHTINLCNQVEGENSVFEFKHLRFHHICLIGIIRNVMKHTNDITYVIDDMTGAEVTVKLQSDENEEMESDENVNPQSHFIENQYIKVYGILKSLQGQKYIQAFRILPIKELNEITYHILECMNTSISHASKNPNAANEEVFSTPSASNPLKNANLNGTYNNDHNGGGGNGASHGGLSGVYMQISSVIKQNKSNEGVHIRDICAYFKNLSESKIREALEFLSTEGHVYSTIDDEHFRSTDAM